MSIQPAAPAISATDALWIGMESQLAGHDYATGAGCGANVVEAWSWADGAGVVASLIDDGFDVADPSLAGRFDGALSRSFAGAVLGSGVTAITEAAGASHGTTTAGDLGGAFGADGPVGVAPGATLVGIRESFGVGTDLAALARGLTYAAGVSDVVNASWSVAAGAANVAGSPVLAGWSAAVAGAVASGRGGLGTAIVFAGGNDRASGDDLGLHAIADDPRVIAVAGLDAGGAACAFSTRGAGLLVAAPATDVATTAPGGGAVVVSGTSYAAPEVSGIVAMMLQANPGLGWRDVQEILADSAYMPQAAAAGAVRNASADWNGGGRHFSDDVGFGAVDAETAVQIARAWTTTSTTSTTADMATASATGTGGAIGAGVTESAATISGATVAGAQVAGALRVQHAQVTLEAASLPAADARIVLVSPGGTRSVLLDRAGFAGADTTGGRTVAGLTLDSNAFRGEAAQGVWHLEVQDAAGRDAGTLGGWSLHVDGDAGAAPLVYTPEFAQLALADASRRVVGAAGATALIVAGDMTGATALDLDGGDGTLDGVAVHVLGGLRNASFTGVAAPVSVTAARAGACTITGGEGPCTITGGDGADVLSVGRGASFVTTGIGGSLVDLQPHRTGADTVLLHGRDTVMAGGGTSHLDVAGPGALVYAQSATLDVTDGSAGSTVVGGAAAATVYGGAGDTVFFTGQGSSFVGGSGTATVIGRGGDTIWAAAGGGQYYAGAASTVSTRSGFSLVTAGAGTLAMLGGDGSDLVVLGGGSDTVDGGAGSGAHTIFAGSGDATILGGTGADIVFAGTGNATLAGGAGSANLFVFVDGAAGGRSAISDFRVGEDHLMLQGYGSGGAADAVPHAIVTGDATILSLADGTQVSLLHVAAASSQVFL